MVTSDLALMDHLDEQLRSIELYLTRHAKVDDPLNYQLLQTVPGIGKVLALVLLYEIHNVRRFESVGRFVSYCRLVKCSHESAGKKSSSKGKKIGNAHLKWAFSEAACLMLREVSEAQSLVARKEKKFGKSCPQAECTLTGDPDPLGSARRFESAGIWGTDEFLGRGRSQRPNTSLPQSPPRRHRSSMRHVRGLTLDRCLVQHVCLTAGGRHPK